MASGCGSIIDAGFAMGFTLLAARTIRCRLSPSAFFHSLGLRYPLTSTRMPFLIASNDERFVFLAHFSTVISEDWRVTSPVALLVTRLLPESEADNACLGAGGDSRFGGYEAADYG